MIGTHYDVRYIIQSIENKYKVTSAHSLQFRLSLLYRVQNPHPMFTENYKGKIHLKTLCALLTLTRIGGGFHNRKEIAFAIQHC